MERQRKLLFTKIGVVMGAIPFLLWAYEYGPDPGYCGVPGEGASCATAGCHTGTANTFSGSVSVAFPNGNTYTPGVKQHLVVTIADPATTQKSWGFQLTARPSNAPKTMAGSFVSTDQFTTEMCASSTNLANFQEMKSGGSQTCPANMTLAYIEHDLAGSQRIQTGSQTYGFDWTPPSTDVGNIVIYVAGNAANGDLTMNGDHIYTKTYTLTPVAAGPAPAISTNGVVNGASFQSGVVAGSWISILGSNLSAVTDTWDKAIVSGKLPTTLDGVSVSVGSKDAVVSFVSPTQINVQAPDIGLGPVPVTVTVNGQTSAASTVTVVQQQPAFFLLPGSQPVATRQDGSLALKNGTYSGVTTVAAKPGDVLILWATGFGPTTPTVPAGIQVPADKQYNCSPVTISLGSASPQVFGCALSPGYAGLYQVAIQVPGSMADGDYPIKATVNGTSSPDGVILSVKK